MDNTLRRAWLFFSVGGVILLIIGLVAWVPLVMAFAVLCFLVSFFCHVFFEMLERLADLQKRVGRLESRLIKWDEDSDH